MNQINCLIVDDEPIARDIIKSYCSHLPILHVVACCENALEAKAELQKQKIDIVFLDINMPVLDGISFLKTLKYKPEVIFTTAYKEFAVDAFDLSACDYLLKPFSLDRFIIAVDKALEKMHGETDGNAVDTTPSDEDFIFVKAEGKIYQLIFDQIIYAEAKGNYTSIVTSTFVLLPVMTFSSFEVLLPKSRFIRVHRSFIINKSKITHIEGNRVFIGKHEIPIGNNYRDEFMRMLGF